KGGASIGRAGDERGLPQRSFPSLRATACTIRTRALRAISIAQAPRCVILRHLRGIGLTAGGKPMRAAEQRDELAPLHLGGAEEKAWTGLVIGTNRQGSRPWRSKGPPSAASRLT